MLANLGIGGYGDDRKRLAFGTFDGPGFASVQDTGRDLVFGNPDWGALVAREQAQYGKRHIRPAAGGAARNHFGTRPATADGTESQRQIGIVLVRIMALNFKVGGGIDQRATCIAHCVGISYIHVAAQAGTQKGIQAAVHGDNVVALPC